MYRKNAQNYKVALPLIKGFAYPGKAWLCYYKGLIMHSRDCHIAVMYNIDCLLRLIAAIYRMTELQSYLQNI